MTYLHVDLRHGVVAVLVNDALGTLLEVGDDHVVPPLNQVPVLVELATCEQHQVIDPQSFLLLRTQSSCEVDRFSSSNTSQKQNTQTQTHTQTQTNIYVHKHTYTQTHKNIYTYKHTDTHRNICLHTYTYTRRRTS